MIVISTMIMALDYGERRIGVAVTDESEKYTKALDYIRNSEPTRKVFKKLHREKSEQEIKEIKRSNKLNAKLGQKRVFNQILHLLNLYYPEKIIIGVPYTLDHENNQIEGKQAKVIKNFGKKLKAFLDSKKIKIEIEYYDETLSSRMAQSSLEAQSITTSEKIKAKIDSESARLLLEEYILGK